MKFLRFWFPVIFYSGIIFYISSIPDVTTPFPEMRFDKILHVIVYIPFGLLVARGFFNTKPSVSRKMLMFTVCLISFLYGVSDEFHQNFVDGRDAGIEDLIADTVGGTIGGYFYLLFINKRNNQ